MKKANLNSMVAGKFSLQKIRGIFLITGISIQSICSQVSWPDNQLLPSFPLPAQTQDLILLNGSNAQNEQSWQWEAEEASMGHKTGRLESEGWLCQTGIDNANDHMVYGPYEKSLTTGPYIATFRIKTDDVTNNEDPIVDIDVRNATTGSILAVKTIVRKNFSTAGEYSTFNLNFLMPADNQSLELRVFWYGTAYTKVDWIKVRQNNSPAEMYLFSSLKGIINKTKPRIFSYEGDAFAEGKHTWLQSLGMDWDEHADRWEVLTKYAKEVSGLIVYDYTQTHTVNLATHLAKSHNAIIAAPNLIDRLTSEPFNLPVLLDLRGQFNSKLEVYQKIYDTYWPNIDHRLLIGLSPEAHKASLREYATALGACVIWLDPKVPGESELLNQFLSSMPAGANYMGWWPEEAPGVERASTFGIATIASDYATNLTMHSGMPRQINLKAPPAKPALQNKIYVAFILSDGDNLQYVEHLMRKLWNNSDRGSVPIGWTISPAMVDAMPGALNYYWNSSTENDNLISGPSGYGYVYPNSWPNQDLLNQFVAKTEEYNRLAGLRVVTVWNTITGGINQNVGESFSDYSSTLLGLTAQNTGGGLSIYKNNLPGMALSCNYCTNEQAMKEHIDNASAGWNGSEPRFVIIQAQPWTDVKPTNFKNVANSLNSDYVVVRPDHIFQLIRESKGLTIDPGSESMNPTSGLITTYEDCNYKGYFAGLNATEFSLSQLQKLRIKNNSISSLKISQGFKAIAFQDDLFSGSSIEFTADQSCFNETWNDQITSIQVKPNGTPMLDETYFIQNKASGLYLDVNGGPSAMDNGAAMIQSEFNGETNQQFTLQDRGDGSYSITAVHSNKSMDVIAISTKAGTKIHQWEYLGSANQRLILVPTENDYYKLILEHSGMVAEVATQKAGEQLRQWYNHDGANAQWKLTLVNTTGIPGADLLHSHKNVNAISLKMNNEVLTLNASNQNIPYEIYNLTGERILIGHSPTLNLSGFQPGIYLAKTELSGEIRIIKFTLK